MADDEDGGVFHQLLPLDLGQRTDLLPPHCLSLVHLPSVVLVIYLNTRSLGARATVAQNRGSWGHFRFWPYSSFLLFSLGSVRLGEDTQWLRTGVHEDSHFGGGATSLSPSACCCQSWLSLALFMISIIYMVSLIKRRKRRQELLQVNVALAFYLRILHYFDHFFFKNHLNI